MRKIIKALYEYCRLNEMEVNDSKTRVILFQKGGHGHKKKHAPFIFGEKTILYVKEYIYLGVNITQTALYAEATEQYLKKAKIACCSTLALIHKIKVNSWKVYSKLFHSLTQSIIMYMSPVYAIRHLDDIEKIQTMFYERLLNLPQCTPNYAIRLETGESHLAVVVFSAVLNWIIKILQMPLNRYPKISLLKLSALAKLRRRPKMKYNWVESVAEIFFKPIGKENWLLDNDFDKLLKNKDKLVEEYRYYWLSNDKNRLINSSSLIIYPEIDLINSAQRYFTMNWSIEEHSIIAQIRLLNNIVHRIVIDRNKYEIAETDYCYKFCKMNNLLHRIIDCEYYDKLRIELELPIKNSTNLDLFYILEQPNYKNIKNLIKFVKKLLIEKAI